VITLCLPCPEKTPPSLRLDGVHDGAARLDVIVHRRLNDLLESLPAIRAQ